jgi:hypothetical protein
MPRLLTRWSWACIILLRYLWSSGLSEEERALTGVHIIAPGEESLAAAVRESCARQRAAGSGGAGRVAVIPEGPCVLSAFACSLTRSLAVLASLRRSALSAPDELCTAQLSKSSGAWVRGCDRYVIPISAGASAAL